MILVWKKMKWDKQKQLKHRVMLHLKEETLILNQMEYWSKAHYQRLTCQISFKLQKFQHKK